MFVQTKAHTQILKFSESIVLHFAVMAFMFSVFSPSRWRTGDPSRMPVHHRFVTGWEDPTLQRISRRFTVRWAASWAVLLLSLTNQLLESKTKLHSSHIKYISFPKWNTSKGYERLKKRRSSKQRVWLVEPDLNNPIGKSFTVSIIEARNQFRQPSRRLFERLIFS